MLQKRKYQALFLLWLSIEFRFQNYSQETVGGLDGDQIKLIRKWLSREPGGDKGGINASLGLTKTQSYSALDSEKTAKDVIDLFNMKTLFQDSGSALVERLFDMGSYTPEEKAKMQGKIKELVEELLPADITVDWNNEIWIWKDRAGISGKSCQRLAENPEETVEVY